MLVGFGNIPAKLQAAVQVIPDSVNKAITSVIVALAKKLPTTGDPKLFKGLIGSIQLAKYQGQTYDFWIAKDGASVKAKVAVVNNGVPQFLTTVSQTDFPTEKSDGNGNTNMSLLLKNGLQLGQLTVPPAQNSKQAPKADPKNAPAVESLNAVVLQEVKQIKIEIEADYCTALGACLSYGTLTCTNHGWIPVQDIQAGMKVLAQNENDRNAAPDWKLVEQTFIRTGRVIHLHLPDGQVIGTTREHPFYLEGMGWTPAGMLQPGDRISMLSREWITIGEIFDTGEYETVYNFRVADWHTYFVGGEGCEVWAHNAYADVTPAGITKGKVFEFSDTNYRADWYVPNAFLVGKNKGPNEAVKAGEAVDVAKGLGNNLQTLVGQYKTAWDNLAADDSQKATEGIVNRIKLELSTANGIYAQLGMNNVSYESYMSIGGSLPTIPSIKPDSLQMSDAAYAVLKARHKKALITANAQRAAARGNYIHQRFEEYAGANGYSYAPHGIDLVHIASNLKFEVQVINAWQQHSGPAFQQWFWRAIQYS